MAVARDVLSIGHLEARTRDGLQLLVQERSILGSDDFKEASADDIGRRVTVHCSSGGIPTHDSAVRIQADHRVIGHLNDGGELPQGVLAPTALGDVADDPPDAHDAPLIVALRFGTVFNPAVFSGSAVTDPIFPNHLLPCRQLPRRSQSLFQVVGVHQFKRVFVRLGKPERTPLSKSSALRKFLGPATAQVKDAVAQKLELPRSGVRVDGHRVDQVIGVMEERPELGGLFPKQLDIGLIVSRLVCQIVSIPPGSHDWILMLDHIIREPHPNGAAEPGLVEARDSWEIGV